MSPTQNSARQDGPRTWLAYGIGCAVLVYAASVGLDAICVRFGWLRGGMLGPVAGSVVSGWLVLGWSRCRAASRSWLAEKEALLGELRTVTYHINNPLNAITANLIALKSEYNAGSVEQIELSSRQIQQAVNRLAEIARQS